MPLPRAMTRELVSAAVVRAASMRGRTRLADQPSARLMRHVRGEMGYSQRQMAASLGVSQSFISKVEHGIRFIDALQYRELASMLARWRGAKRFLDDPPADDRPCLHARTATNLEDLLVHVATCVDCQSAVCVHFSNYLPHGAGSRLTADSG